MSSLRSVPGQKWLIDAVAREVVHGGERIRLAEKPFLVLLALIEADGEVVTRGALQRRLWSDDTFVDFDNNLNSAVATLRQVLAARVTPAAGCIETVPKVGYRLRIPERALEPSPQAARAIVPQAQRRLPIVAVVGAALVLGTVAALGSLWLTPAPSGSAALSTSNRDARALFERATHLRARFFTADGNVADLSAARDAFAEAHRLDPRFAAAAAEEAETLVDMSFAGAIGVRDGMSRARAAAQRALDLDPEQPVALRVRGIAALVADWDFPGARRWLDRAAGRGADARTSLAQAMWLAAAGRHAEAIAKAERAVALDPGALYVRADLAMFYLAADRGAEAAASSRHVLDTSPDFAPARAYALMAHERLGQWEDAAREARALMRAGGASADELARMDEASGREAVQLWRRWELSRLEQQSKGRRPDFALQYALRHAALGERDAALAALDEALAHRNPLLVFLRSYPELAPLRGDAAFEAVARAVTTSADGPA